MHEIAIRSYRSADAQSLADIFYDSIHQVAVEHYSPAQVNAWAPLPRQYADWQQRFAAKPPFVAELAGVIVGFMTLEHNGHIDWTYTHHAYQRQGIASALYRHLEAEARRQDIARLFVEASHLARPFFDKQGFSVIRQNEVPIRGQVLVNWHMHKHLWAV